MPEGYRRPGALSRDLGLVARFVGINLLFTTSPLYDPLVAAPGPGGDRVVDMNMFEDDPASQGTDWITPAFTRARWQEFQPYYDWRMALRDVDPIDKAPSAPCASFRGCRTRTTAGTRSATRLPSCSASSTRTRTSMSPTTVRTTTWRRPSTSTPPRQPSGTSSACLDSPMTTGWTAPRPSCSPSAPRRTARSATASPTPSSTRSAITSGCRIPTMAGTPSSGSTMGRAATSTSPGRATRATPSWATSASPLTLVTSTGTTCIAMSSPAT